MSWLGATYNSQGRVEEAVGLLRPSLQRMRRTLGEDDYITLVTARHLGRALLDQRRFAEAEELLRDTIEKMTRRDFAEADVLMTQSALAKAFFMTGRVKEAERMAVELVEGFRRIEGDGGRQTLFHEMKLGEIYADWGRYDEAEHLLRRSAAGLPRVVGDGHELTREAISALVRVDSLRSNRQARKRVK